MADDNIFEALDEYKEAFGDTVTIMGLSPELHAKAAGLLKQAVEDDEPFDDDADWYNALGVDPPGQDELV